MSHFKSQRSFPIVALRLLGGGLFLLGLVGQHVLVTLAGLMTVLLANTPTNRATDLQRPQGPAIDDPLNDRLSRLTSDCKESQISDAALPKERIFGPNAPRPVAQQPKPKPTPEARSATPALRLRPIVPIHPGTPIHSWLGGTPHMPDDIDWPMVDGKPALFLAQIACADLPDSLWGGLGPREGWLLAFTSQENPGTPILRHSLRFGHERQPPGPIISPALEPMRDDVLGRATGHPYSIPRWPLELIEERITTPLQPRAKTRRPGHSTGHPDDAPRARPIYPETSKTPPETSLSDPRLHPFDWDTLLILVESLKSELDWDYRVVSGLVDPDHPDPAIDAFLDTLDPARDGISALSAELHGARADGLAFSPALLDLTLKGLGALSFSSFDIELGTSFPTPLLQDPHILSGYFRWFDHHARRAYTETPDLLPPTQRRMFEHRWARLARHELGDMGYSGPEQDSDLLTVIRLPESDLMGWSFGLSGAFHIQASAQALETGALNIGGDPPAHAMAATG